MKKILLHRQKLECWKCSNVGHFFFAKYSLRGGFWYAYCKLLRLLSVFYFTTRATEGDIYCENATQFKFVNRTLVQLQGELVIVEEVHICYAYKRISWISVIAIGMRRGNATVNIPPVPEFSSVIATLCLFTLICESYKCIPHIERFIFGTKERIFMISYCWHSLLWLVISCSRVVSTVFLSKVVNCFYVLSLTVQTCSHWQEI